ncbi:MAG: hypothetical protein KC503_15905 [Myxococcales bacterium]|nr:hypothetical protein [Myxococcales bacterium]
MARRARHTALVAAALLVATLSSARDAQANPWTRDAGHFYVNLNYSRISARSLFAADGSSLSLRDVDLDGVSERFTQNVLALYGEVGIISRWLTATVNATLLRHAKLDLQGSTLGLGDITLGFWSGLLTGPIRLSAGIAFGLPTGDPAPTADNPTDAGVAAVLPTGDGEFDVEFMLAAGYAFGGRGKTWPLSHYVVGRVGYHVRTTPREQAFGDPKDFPDAFNWRFEVGTKIPYTFVDRFWLIVRLYGTEIFSGDAGQNATGLGPVVFTSYGIEIYGRIVAGLGASFGFNGAFRAKGLPAGANLAWSLSYEY